MNIDSKQYVGIFWFYSAQMIYKSVLVETLKPDSLGLIDSPYLHITEWELNQIYLPKFPELCGTEYQELPRGRVIFDQNSQVFKVILDKDIFTKRKVVIIQSCFGLNHSRVEYHADPHYKTFSSI